MKRNIWYLIYFASVLIIVIALKSMIFQGCHVELEANGNIKNGVESSSLNIMDSNIFNWTDEDIHSRMNNIYYQIQILKNKADKNSIVREKYFYYSNLLGMELQILQHVDYVNDR